MKQGGSKMLKVQFIWNPVSPAGDADDAFRIVQSIFNNWVEENPGYQIKDVKYQQDIQEGKEPLVSMMVLYEDNSNK